jgi:hypothetical protein
VLHRPDAFEPLTHEPWNEAAVRDAIARIAADTDAAFHADTLWPAEQWDAWGSRPPLTGLYVGAAGVIWALDALRRRGRSDTRIDLVAAIERTLVKARASPDLSVGGERPPTGRAGLLVGETGMLAVAWRLSPSPSFADELHALVRENAGTEPDEVMWGTPGSLLAAKALFDWTGEPRWAEAWRDSAAALLGRRDADGVWTQRLPGEVFRGLGPVHGLVGNVRALLGGGELLAAEERTTLTEETAAVLARTAVVEEGLANWPLLVDAGLDEPDGQIRLQWCTGAPGIVAAARDYLDEELLQAGARLVHRAGAPGSEKGAGICHGTAGNGYALLAAFERTGDERWLGLARRFAVHGLLQVERGRADRGRGRYSLWTGDVGVALYASDCLDGRFRYPILESWD